MRDVFKTWDLPSFPGVFSSRSAYQETCGIIDVSDILYFTDGKEIIQVARNSSVLTKTL